VRIVLRELKSPEEFRETEEISKTAWRFTDRAVSPASDLIATTHSGGLTAAAFEGRAMLGFVHGVPRTNRDEPCQHSHLLAVRPEAQGRGLSGQLKLFQRRWCLDHGIKLVTWTYDPFLLKNATLNIGKLRATVANYLPNFYGLMGGIYGAIPTDRFEVTWRLDDPIVERAAEGHPLRVADDPDAPVVTGTRVPNARRVVLPFPAGAPRIYETDPEGCVAARKRFRRVADALFAKGFEVIGVAVRESGPVYILERR